MYYSINNLSNLRVVYGTDYVINIYHCPEKRENLKKIPNLVDVASGVFFVKITRTIGYLFFILQHKINKPQTAVGNSLDNFSYSFSLQTTVFVFENPP